jgi:chemotaxis protein CheZ
MSLIRGTAMADSFVDPEFESDDPSALMPMTESRETGGNLAIGLITIRQEAIPRAIEQLDDIVRGTEGAAHQVLDACAALEALGDEIGGEVAERISQAVTPIYEACCFQDLAGQRITSVTKTLGLIEGKLSELTSEFGILAGDYQGLASMGGGGIGSFGDVLLAGPQHPEAATDQASIDQLFGQVE